MRTKPVYLNLFTFAFPVTAIISILHRISGVLILLMLPVFLGILQDGLYYPWSQSITSHVLIWFALTVFVYHLLAGIRHLFMDVGLGEEKNNATISAYIVLVATFICSVMIGIRLC